MGLYQFRIGEMSIEFTAISEHEAKQILDSHVRRPEEWELSTVCKE